MMGNEKKNNPPVQTRNGGTGASLKNPPKFSHLLPISLCHLLLFEWEKQQ
jgi:hypothetical protein